MDKHPYAELTRALKWYEELAKSMQRASLRVDNQVALHILKTLALDGGKKARAAIANAEGVADAMLAERGRGG